MMKNKKAVFLNMNNSNAWISLACVGLNADNPYSTFCEYIKYCIYTSGCQQMTIPQIHDTVNMEFGIDLPIHILESCLKIIIRNGEATSNNYMIKYNGEYDASAFEKTRNEFRKTEHEIVTGLISFAARHGINFDFDTARAEITNILDKDDLSYNMFANNGDATNIEFPSETYETNDEIECSETEASECPGPLFTVRYVVAKYIQEILYNKSDSLHKEYLIKICTGLMVCAGIYQFSHKDSADKRPGIKGTEFFFDTRLLLRLLGCGKSVAVKATTELVDLIQSSGGRVYYYSHTKDEVDNAFKKAVGEIRSGGIPSDDEMRVLACSINNDITVMSLKKTTFEDELRKKGIYEKKEGTYTDIERIKFGFNLDSLKKYMYEKLEWHNATIDNDALSVWETHIKRKNNYSEYCGGRNKLPVFVTNNVLLPKITLAFKTDGTAGSENLQWDTNRLPVITDTRLMCRIWSPASQADKLPRLCLCANVMGALRPTKKYINSLKSKVELLKSNGIGAEIDLPVFFNDKFEEVVFNTVSNINADINVDEVAGSIDELKDMLIGDAKKKATDAEEELKKVKCANDTMKESIISAAVSQLKEPSIWLKLTLYSPSIAFGALAVLLAILNVISGKWGAGIAAATSAALSIAGLILPKRLTKYMSEAVYPKIKKRYIMNIKKSLRESERPYEEEIVERAISESEWIKKVKNAYGIKESTGENAPH